MGNFFGFSLMAIAGEGSDYFLDAIRNCNIFKTENKSPILLRNADDVTIERCYVESDTRNAITAVRVNTVKILGNQIKSQKKSAIAINDCKKHIEEQNIVVKK